jgi:hypothetical protein
VIRPCRNSTVTMPQLNGDHAASERFSTSISTVPKPHLNGETMPQVNGGQPLSCGCTGFLSSLYCLRKFGRKSLTLLLTETAGSGFAPLRALPTAVSAVIETRATATPIRNRTNEKKKT